MNAFLILDDDDIFKVSLFTTGQGIHPVGSASVQPDCKFIKVTVGSVPDVMTIQVAMETLWCFTFNIYFKSTVIVIASIELPWSR